MSTDKKNKGASLKNIVSNRKFRYGGFSLATIIAVIAAVVLVNVGISALDSNWNLKLDATSNNLFSISPQTQEVMTKLEEPVQFIALFPEGNANNEVVELLNRYRMLNRDLISVEVVDPVRNPTYASRFDPNNAGIPEGSVIVTSRDETRYRVIQYQDMYEYDYDSQTYERYAKAFIGEQHLTNAVVFVSAESQQRVYFAASHNEVPLSEYPYVVSPLEQLNLEVKEATLADYMVLQPNDILIFNAPQRDISMDEREYIRLFLDSGGKLLYMRNAGDPPLENMESLLALYGVTVEHDLLVDMDPSSNQLNNPVVIVPRMLSHTIIDAMSASRLVPVLPYASSFTISDVTVYGRNISAFLTTSELSYGKTNFEDTTIEMSVGDLPGPRNVGLAVEQEQSNGLTTKIVVLGNSMFISSEEFMNYSGNGDLFFDSVRWMQGTSSAVSIVGKSLLGNRLNITTFAQFVVLMVLVVLVIPLAILATGLVIWLRRRHS